MTSLPPSPPAPRQPLLQRGWRRVRALHTLMMAWHGDERLPARVRASIARQQENSEVVIGWVQLGIVLMFASLYALAPQPLDSTNTASPVPFALAAYFGFTAIRLALAHRRALPSGFLYLSVIIDIGLLMALIWSFHIQYQQPASFYLKVPTVLYLFIFIALRALRFEAGFVILAGVVSALGWLALVWYATSVDPDNPMITRDYVEYMTSNSVLLGAEFDKVITILIVTGILALSLARAQRLLVRATLEGSRARALSRFVPDEVAEGAAGQDQPYDEDRAEVGEATVLFIDIEGFTSLSEDLAPTEIIETLNEYFAAVAEPLERHMGVITQFQGDAVLASFNIPRADEDHAHSAIEAAIEMQERLDSRRFGPRGVSLRARIGINTGPIVGGLVGTPDRVSYTVHGDAVNLAARLEVLNKDYGTRILVSERTREHAGTERFGYIGCGEVQVRGKRAPVRVFAIPVPP